MAIAATGTMVGIGFLSMLSALFDAPMLVASFGASAVLLYSVPESPLARYRNVLFGHVLSATIGVVTVFLLGNSWVSMTAAVSLSIVAMMVTDTVHPPGGATALACVMSSAGPSFIIAPVTVGISFMIVVAHGMNRLRRDSVRNQN